MKKWLLGLGLLFTLCGCANEQILFESQDELDIIVATDLHYYASSLFEDCSWFSQAWEQEDGQMIHYTHKFVENFVSEVISQDPDLVIISGDLTYNGEKVSHEALANELSRLTEAGIEVAVINGNHDVNNDFAYGYNEEGSYSVEGIDTQEFVNIYHTFGYEKAYSKDSHSLSYALHLNNSYDLLVIDSCKDASYRTGSDLQEDTMKWIEKELEKTSQNNKKTIVSMHHNLGIHCEAISTNYVLDNADEMQALFDKYQVPVVLSGHVHIQHTSQFNDTYEIVTSALSIAPVQYGVMHVTEDSIDYHTQQIESVEGDETFFVQTSYNKFSKTLTNYFEEEQAKNMALYLANLNLSYFSGNTYLYRDDYIGSDFLEELYASDDNLDFYKQYIDVMLSETTNHQELYIDLSD